MKVVPANNATANFRRFERKRKIPKFNLKAESLNLEECKNSTIFLEQIEEWTSMLATMMSIYLCKLDDETDKNE